MNCSLISSPSSDMTLFLALNNTADDSVDSGRSLRLLFASSSYLALPPARTVMSSLSQPIRANRRRAPPLPSAPGPPQSNQTNRHTSSLTRPTSSHARAIFKTLGVPSLTDSRWSPWKQRRAVRAVELSSEPDGFLPVPDDGDPAPS